MSELLKKIESVEFITGENFSYDLNREFVLISSILEPTEQECLKLDFDRFLEKGRFAILNTFSGGILFLKVPERIDRIKIESWSNSNNFEFTSVFESPIRREENIKFKPDVGKSESVIWRADSIFPNFFQYDKEIKKALLLIIGRLVKRICEYGRINFAYMEIENEFEVELIIDGRLELTQKVETG